MLIKIICKLTAIKDIGVVTNEILASAKWEESQRTQPILLEQPKRHKELWQNKIRESEQNVKPFSKAPVQPK